MTDYSAAGRTAGRRRAAVVTGICCAVFMGACTASNGPTDPSQPPTSAVPARSVTTANLLTVGDMPNEDPMSKKVVEAADNAGRPVSESYICLPTNGLGSLGATSMVTRDFTYKIINADSDPYPDSPLKNKPSIYTQALQFPDEATATAARATYAGWIKGCPATLTKRGYVIDTDQSLKLSTLKVEGAKAQAGMTAYVKPDAKDTEDLYWESASITQVKDRLMIMVTISWGMDSPGTFDTSDGDFVNPQAILTRLAAEALTK